MNNREQANQTGEIGKVDNESTMIDSDRDGHLRTASRPQTEILLGEILLGKFLRARRNCTYELGLLTAIVTCLPPTLNKRPRVESHNPNTIQRIQTQTIYTVHDDDVQRTDQTMTTQTNTHSEVRHTVDFHDLAESRKVDRGSRPILFFDLYLAN